MNDDEKARVEEAARQHRSWGTTSGQDNLMQPNQAYEDAYLDEGEKIKRRTQDDNQEENQE
jgi:hypothetical protein